MVKINGHQLIERDDIGEPDYTGKGTTRALFAAHCNKFLLDHGQSIAEFGYNNWKPKRKKKCKPSNGVEHYEFESDVLP